MRVWELGLTRGWGLPHEAEVHAQATVPDEGVGAQGLGCMVQGFGFRVSQSDSFASFSSAQGNLAHKNTPTLLGPR